MQSKICIVVLTSDNDIKQELIKGAIVSQDNGYSVLTDNGNFTISTANGYPAGSGGK